MSWTPTRLDPARPPEWLRQEIFLDPPEGARRYVDLVARVGMVTLGPLDIRCNLLWHIEAEAADSLTTVREHMGDYHDPLKWRHGLPVLSVALYLSVALEGRGFDEAREVVEGMVVNTRRWPYLALPGLDGADYLEGGNMLGVAFSARMRIPEADKPRHKARAMQRLAESALDDRRKAMLVSFVEAYMPLLPPAMAEYEHLMTTKEFRMAIELAKTSEEIGEERGQRRIVRELIEDAFGPLPPEAAVRFDALSDAEVRAVGLKLRRADSLADLGLDPAAEA